MAVSNDPKHMYAAPVAGASLTKQPGSSPWLSSPPQFHDEMAALNYMWNVALKDPKTITKIVVFLKGGVSVTEIVNTFLFTGMAGNKWSPDLALLMYQEVAWMIEAVAKTAKVKYTFKKMDPSYAQFLIKYKDYLQEPTATPIEQTAKRIFGNITPTKA